MSAGAPPQVESTSECSILLRFGERIDQSCNERVHAAFRAVSSPPIAGIIEIIPSYASLAIHYDPLHWIERGMDQSPDQRITDSVLERLANSIDNDAGTTARTIEIPVCYDPELGEDLVESSLTLGISIDDLIARHVDVEYRVAMLGFAPGFPYLLGLDPRLQLPRRSQPRVRVPAGSVAIGGAQTGIYPTGLPGGWHLIGRTPLQLFDISRQPPQLVNAGERVRFIPISREQFDALSRNSD